MPFVRHQTMLKKKKPSRDDWATKMSLSPKIWKWAFQRRIIKDNPHSAISFLMLRCWGDGENLHLGKSTGQAPAMADNGSQI